MEDRFPEILTTEKQLRNLLRAERRKNELLSADYSRLQKQNVELATELQILKKQNERLVGENNKFRDGYSLISRS